MADGVMYWEDVTETLAAFIEAFPAGGALLMQSKGPMAVQLASVHDSLLPHVHACMSGAPSADTLKVPDPSLMQSVCHPELSGYTLGNWHRAPHIARFDADL